MTDDFTIRVNMRLDLDEHTGIRVFRAFPDGNPPGYFATVSFAAPVFAMTDGNHGVFARALDAECRGLAKDVTSRYSIVTSNGAVVVDAAGRIVHATKEWHPVVAIARFIGTQRLADLIREHVVAYLTELSAFKTPTDYEKKRALGYTDDQIRQQAGRRAP